MWDCPRLSLHSSQECSHSGEEHPALTCMVLTTYIMTLASSINSSSDMEPSLIILMATSYWPLHFPYFTTPNCPVPSSFRKVRSLGSISHDPRTESVNVMWVQVTFLHRAPSHLV